MSTHHDDAGDVGELLDVGPDVPELDAGDVGELVDASRVWSRLLALFRSVFGAGDVKSFRFTQQEYCACCGDDFTEHTREHLAHCLAELQRGLA